jgi:thiol-disulfide isomerase/thioredoxin
MNMKKLMFLLFCLPMIALAGEKTKVKFFKGVLREDLKEVKAIAKAENKLILLDFSASWCMPCRWMEENTFNNAELADFMAKNYIPVKVDIDDIEGFALKERHKVEVLPTMIVFDASGKVLGRYAESMGPKKMLETLSKYKPSGKATTATKPEVQKPVLTPKPPVKAKKVIYAPGTGLYKVDISRQVSEGFSIQVSSASQYDNVVKKFEELKTTYKKPVLIHIDMNGNKPTYKIMVGEFKKREDAEKFMKDKKIQGFIKELSPMTAE